jgi:transposase
MARTLSMDVRRRFARLVEGGMSGRAAAARLMLSASTGTRLARQVREGGDLTPMRRGRPAGAGKLGPHRAALREMVEANADITMPELARALEDATGIRAAPASLSRALRRWGFRVKESP